jgi:hypothetical protein
MPDTIEQIAAKIADCQRRLDEAELRRAPSTRLEAELDALHRERGKLLSDQASAERAAREAEAEAIEQAAAETADIVGRVTAVLPAITIPTPEVDDGPIRAAARHHARAKAGFDKATAILAERQKHADDLAGLIAEHQHTLDQIGDRLMAGTELPSDNVQRLRSFQFVERKKPLHQAAMGEVRAAEAAVRLAETVRQRAASNSLGPTIAPAATATTRAWRHSMRRCWRSSGRPPPPIGGYRDSPRSLAVTNYARSYGASRHSIRIWRAIWTPRTHAVGPPSNAPPSPGSWPEPRGN